MYQSTDNKRNTRMKPTFAKRGPHQRTSPARRRGSLLILCVTILVIIAMVGIAYLQRARMDQFATARHERGYINHVINGILGEISTQMEQDVNRNQIKGHFLYDYPWTNPNKHDYMATREYPNPALVAVNGYLDTGADIPGPEDDRWLASTAPVWHRGDNEYRWLHLSNITGIFLDLPDPNDPTANDVPIERLIDFRPPQIGQAQFGANQTTDTDLTLTKKPINGLAYNLGGYEARGVDADGDGIIDSRWQWAPLSVRRLGGRRYVMAIRIIDLNSMLNVNTASSLTINGTPGLPLAARGHSPAWVDLSRLMRRVPFSAPSNTWKRELSTILNFRIQKLIDTGRIADGYSDGLDMILESTDDVRLMWEEQGSIYGSTDRNILMDSELELRRFGGLNDRSLTSVLETMMGQVPAYGANSQYSKALRQHIQLSDDLPPIGTGQIGPEGSYRNVVDPNKNFTQNENISRWFYGDNNGTPVDDADSIAVAIRKFPAIRHMLTASSGTAVYSVHPSPSAINSNRTKFDLHRDWTSGDLVQARIKLREQLKQAFREPAGGASYLNLSLPNVDDLIEEYANAIEDYCDPDSIPSKTTLSTGIVYGLEKLPFLREVYVQALYADKDVRDDINNLGPGDAGYLGPDGVSLDTWVYDPSVTGNTKAMVIELGNPFAHRINGVGANSGEGLDGNVSIVVRQGGNSTTFLFGDVVAMEQTPDIDPRDDTDTGDILVVYSPPIDKNPEGNGGTHDGTDLLGDVGVVAGVQELKLTPGYLTNNFTPGGGTLIIELWVETPDGPKRYDRLETEAATQLPGPSDVSMTHTPTPIGSENPQFAQASFARDSNKINYVVDDGVAAGDLEPAIPNEGGTYVTTVSRLGNDTKGSATITSYASDPTFYDRLQLPLSDLPMSSLAELASLHMFGFTQNATFSERMSAEITQPGFSSDEHFLLVDPRDPSNPGAVNPAYAVTNLGVPHAALLMDLFTTVSPRYDGFDNDNDDGNNIITDGDSRQEIFVPGPLNVNTMPMHLLTLGSPMGENLDDAEALMRTIVAYRDEPLREGLRTTGQHGNYWPSAGFNVTQIRNQSATNVPGFPGAVPADRLNRPGIASLGELMYLNPNATLDSNNNAMRYGMDGLPSLITGSYNLDMYPDPDHNGSSIVDQGDDNEQLLARFGMLSQAYTVRSDRFAVYCVVRGYKDKRFNKAPVETARFIAIIDRGIMATAGTDTPRVIGFVRLQ